jgi:hypothetical protein
MKGDLISSDDSQVMIRPIINLASDHDSNEIMFNRGVCAAMAGPDKDGVFVLL